LTGIIDDHEPFCIKPGNPELSLNLVKA